jgi:hypothetical protein
MFHLIQHFVAVDIHWNGRAGRTALTTYASGQGFTNRIGHNIK